MKFIEIELFLMLKMSILCGFLMSFQYLGVKKASFMKVAVRSISTSSTLTFQESPIQQIEVFSRRVFIKRDDLCQLHPNIGIAGNKVRKLQSLIESKNFPRTVISYGGTQSNAMRALARLCSHKQSRFVYFCRKIPEILKMTPSGNYLDAVQAGMEIIERGSSESIDKENWKSFFSESSMNVPEDSVLCIPQGAACEIAKAGIYRLCDNILQFIIKSTENQKTWKILFASGTGVSAYYAHQFFRDAQSQLSNLPNIEVVAIPCATSDDILRNDMRRKFIGKEGADSSLPRILSTSSSGISQSFARPSLLHLSLWRELSRQSGSVLFDLIYAPRAWEILLAQTKKNSQEMQTIDEKLSSSATEGTALDSLLASVDVHSERWKRVELSWEPEANLLYYHCGGLEGNPSQLARYQRTRRWKCRTTRKNTAE